MIGEWSWLWSENDHDQCTPIMGADCVWSSLLFLSCLSNWKKLRHLTANSKKPAACGKIIKQIRNEFWNAQPALWSEQILKLEHVWDQRYPVLREQTILNPHKIQIWFKLQDQFLPPWLGVARDNTETYFFGKRKSKFTMFYFVRTKSRLLQLRSHGVMPANKPILNKKWCDKDRALDNVSHVTWMTCDTVQCDKSDMALLIKSVRECDSCCILLSNL